MDPNWSNVFTQPESVPFIRYLALNLGMGGLFTQLTPRMLIEGYQNPFLTKMF